MDDYCVIDRTYSCNEKSISLTVLDGLVSELELLATIDLQAT